MLEMVNTSSLVEYERDDKTGLLVKKIDNRVAEVGQFKTQYKYNSVSPRIFEYNWPKDIKVVDKRDNMHKRGWTYFRIEGQIGGKQLSGLGRIPFVYNKSKTHPAWLKLNIDDNLQIIDSSKGAFLLDSKDKVIASFAPGSFFAGLGRPWTGIRAYDTVQRDAARKKITFESERIEEQGRVVLLKKKDYSLTRVNYQIDMEKDLIEKINLSLSGGIELAEGVLKFSYLDDISRTGDEFAEPGRIDSDLPIKKPMGVLWLLRLIHGSLESSVEL